MIPLLAVTPCSMRALEFTQHLPLGWWSLPLISTEIEHEACLLFLPFLRSIIASCHFHPECQDPWETEAGYRNGPDSLASWHRWFLRRLQLCTQPPEQENTLLHTSLPDVKVCHGHTGSVSPAVSIECAPLWSLTHSTCPMQIGSHL